MKEKILEKLNAAVEGAVLETTEHLGDLSVKVKAENLVEVATVLRDDPELAFTALRDVTAVDWATRKERFTCVYHVYSFENNFLLRVKADPDENNEIDSVEPVWKSANWYERETYDMLGIKFKNHPDLRRMYMPEEFKYHPLRKDLPVMGIPGSIPLPNKEN